MVAEEKTVSADYQADLEAIFLAADNNSDQEQGSKGILPVILSAVISLGMWSSPMIGSHATAPPRAQNPRVEYISA